MGGFNFPNEPAMPLNTPRPPVRRIRRTLGPGPRSKTLDQIEQERTKERDDALDINKEIGKRK